MEYSFDDKLERILGCSFRNSSFEVDRTLVHAYIACLTFEELGEAICRTISSNTKLRLALRNRLVKVVRQSNGEYADALATLVKKSRRLYGDDSVLRRRVDALHSTIYEFLPLPARQEILEGWIDRGSSEAAGRWLKAITSDETLFDGQAVLSYWRASGDVRAAKLLAYQAEPALLDEAQLELARLCDEGWIISKAAMRASKISEEVWEVVRGRLPATYAYMCSQSGRKITDDEAFALVKESPSDFMDDQRGLAIWAIGQMGMISVLDRISEASGEFAHEQMVSLRTRYQTERSDTAEPPAL